MALKDIVKINRKTFFNPRGWLDYDALKEQTLYIYSLGKAIVTPVKPEFEETFTEAMERLNLTETDVQQTKENYFLYAIMFVAFGVFTFVFSFYLLFHYGSILGWILGLAVVAAFLSQAFRYHFWYFQMKHRKLGCTFDEWKRGRINEDSAP